MMMGVEGRVLLGQRRDKEDSFTANFQHIKHHEKCWNIFACSDGKRKGNISGSCLPLSFGFGWFGRFLFRFPGI